MSEKEKTGTRREFVASAGAASGLAVLATLLGGGKLANAQQIELNAMGPTPEQAAAFASLPDRPVVMVNLLKFSPGGASANAQYSADVAVILEKIGAERIFSGMCQGTFIGGVEWDRIALVRYPSARALLEMAQSEEYRAISGNRTASLEGQINIAVFET